MEKTLYTHDSPEASTVSTEHLSEGKLAIDDVDHMRTLQKQRVAENRAAEGFYDIPAQEAADERSYAEFDASIEDYLQARGIDSESPHYTTYASILRDNSIDRVNNDMWMLSETNDVGEYTASSVREKTAAQLEGLSVTEEDSAPDSSTSSVERDPAIERGEEKLASLREQLAAASAKRQGRLFGKGKQYEALQEEYNTQLIKLGKLKLHEGELGTPLTDSEKNVAAISYIFDEQQKLREKTKEELQGTKVHKFIEWFNSGTKGERFRRGVYLGLGGVVVGAGLGALAGVAAGAGVAGAATAAAVSGTRFARYFAKKDNQQGRGMEKISDAATEDHNVKAMQYIERNDASDKVESASNYFTNTFEEDTKKEQSKRRKSVRAGLAGVAIGAVAGGTIAYAISEMNDGSVGEWSNRHIAPETHAQPDINSEADGGAGVNEVDQPVEKPAPGADGTEEPLVPAPEVDAIVPSDTPEMAEAISDALDGDSSNDMGGETLDSDYSGEALDIHTGEGWLQTFSEMGITDVNEQYALLHNQDMMNELYHMGLAYPDATLGGWGINMTHDGKMPAAALDVIANYAK